ncbi:Activated Cdc42 kinase-like [Taenia solium]|eukprot:TsM_000361900 transcript=TsM_000361900 gene=TsM_000361900
MHLKVRLCLSALLLASQWALGMLSQPYSTPLASSHQVGTLENRNSSDRLSLQRTSSVSSLLFARRPSTTSSLASTVSNQISPLHQYIQYRQIPSSSSIELDHCWGGGTGGSGGGRRSREDQRDSYQDLYDFLNAADLEEYYTVFSKHLKIRMVNQLKYVTDVELVEMGMSRPEMRRLRRHFEKECPQTAMGKLKKKLARSTSARPPPRYQRASTEPPADDRESIFGDSSGISGYRIIPAFELELTSPLGQGEFGRVHQASRCSTWSGPVCFIDEGCEGSWRPASMGRQLQVAVKVLDLERFPTKMDDFLKEAAIMNSLDHPDIVRLYGICVAPNCLRLVSGLSVTSSPILYLMHDLVTELAPLRSLLECLREPDLRASFPVATLHNFAIQIARGMAYLEEERLVHRDLAARNILVFAKDRLWDYLIGILRPTMHFESLVLCLVPSQVKIGDFGLSRALQLGKSYYQTNFNANLRLPIAWCALEAIHELRFTSASDVWSYGVTLWEMFTYGFVPWAGLSGRQILEAVDIPNCRRLTQPDTCPDAVFDAVMRACWNHEPTSRPTFTQLVEMLPHLSPQAWCVVEDGGETEPAPPRTVQDIRNLLTENAPQNGNTVADTGADDVANSAAQNDKILLRVRAGETVYVLSKKDPELWKVVSHSTCQVGYVPPENLRIVADTTDTTALRPSGTNQHRNHHASTLSRMRLRFSRRESNRNSPRGGKKFNRDLISLPQNDFRHVGHVGADGTMFGDVGFSLDNVDEDERGETIISVYVLATKIASVNPANSCMTIESMSDKENPCLSDATIGEDCNFLKDLRDNRDRNSAANSVTKFALKHLFTNQRASRNSSVALDWTKVIPPRAVATTTTTTSTTATSSPPPLSSTSENSRISSAANSNFTSTCLPIATETAVAPSSSPWFTTSNTDVEDPEPSILDMGSSFMDEIFQCLSTKTDGLALLDTVSSSNEAHQSNPVVSEPPLPLPSPTVPRRDAKSLPPEEVLPASPLLPVIHKPSRSREATPFGGSYHNTTANPIPMKRLSLDHTNDERYEESPPTLCSPTKAVGRSSRTSLVDNSPLRWGRVGEVGEVGGGSGVFVNATNTLTRAFRKSSASLTRRPTQAASGKAPSALSLEQPLHQHQVPPIKARLDAAGKLKRPAISGPVMISNPTLVVGASVASILSSEGTTTAAVSTPPSSSTSSRGTSRGSSITAISSPFSMGGVGAVTPITTTTPSISPAPSTSSLATSSTSSSNLVLHHLGHAHYQGSRFTGAIGAGGSGGGGLRALRDRGDLVFRAPAASTTIGGWRRTTPVTGTDHQHRSPGYTGSTLDRRHRYLLPSRPATVTLPRRNNLSLRDRTNVNVTERTVDAARLSSYSARERVVDPIANPLASETEISPSVVTPTATDYTFVPPTQPEGLQRKTPPSFEETSVETISSSLVSPPPPSSGGDSELSEELLSLWGSELASILGGHNSVAS